MNDHMDGGEEAKFAEAGDRRRIDAPFSSLLREIAIRMRPAGDGRLAELGLSAQQGQMLRYIHMFQEQGIIQNDLAKRFDRTNASITSMLQGLEKKGYVKRIVPEGNERKKMVYVTDKAEALMSEFDRIFFDTERQITAGMTDEEAETLRRLLEKVRDNF
ncbi:MarR family winged helix-turn-helix transcriptional regulator [Saccharibacillus sp. O23]|uniref:MarR family winged helix-turn-helix transcriptional regulator n=1 Tax=Saccharibacillus sp. O23 TaxID=2009338 RepID=UPI00211AA68A|nr:MarR family transcriptional regulator [Saccharibacillus sp. O23]